MGPYATADEYIAWLIGPQGSAYPAYANAAAASGGLISAQRLRSLRERGIRGVFAPQEINGIAAAFGRPTNEILNHIQRLG